MLWFWFPGTKIRKNVSVQKNGRWSEGTLDRILYHRKWRLFISNSKKIQGGPHSGILNIFPPIALSKHALPCPPVGVCLEGFCRRRMPKTRSRKWCQAKNNLKHLQVVKFNHGMKSIAEHAKDFGFDVCDRPLNITFPPFCLSCCTYFFSMCLLMNSNSFLFGLCVWCGGGSKEGDWWSARWGVSEVPSAAPSSKVLDRNYVEIAWLTRQPNKAQPAYSRSKPMIWMDSLKSSQLIGQCKYISMHSFMLFYVCSPVWQKLKSLEGILWQWFHENGENELQLELWAVSWLVRRTCLSTEQKTINLKNMGTKRKTLHSVEVGSSRPGLKHVMLCQAGFSLYLSSMSYGTFFVEWNSHGCPSGLADRKIEVGLNSPWRAYSSDVIYGMSFFLANKP